MKKRVLQNRKRNPKRPTQIYINVSTHTDETKQMQAIERMKRHQISNRDEKQI